jgi:hypothetical protein
MTSTCLRAAMQSSRSACCHMAMRRTCPFAGRLGWRRIRASGIAASASRARTGESGTVLRVTSARMASRSRVESATQSHSSNEWKLMASSSHKLCGPSVHDATGKGLYFGSC